MADLSRRALGTALPGIALALLALGTCSQPSPLPAPEEGPARGVAASGSVVDGELLEQLAVLATGKRSDELYGPAWRPRWQAELTSGKRTLDAYVDALLEHPAFAETIATRIFVQDLLIKDLGKGINQYLRKSQVGGATVYHLNAPCAVADAVAVRPWWDLGAEVLVCADSYRPDLAGHDAYGTWTYCGATLASKDCGCGPSLIRCARSREHLDELAAAASQEIRMTMAHVVRSGLPIASLFTMNATVRTGLAELLYRRMQPELAASTDVAAQLGDLALWQEAALRPRPERWPGEHAGILTTPMVLYAVMDGRQRMRELFNMLWCAPVSSVGATAQDVLALGKNNLQGKHEGWEELARRPVCTNCHARLDYGMQFFLGYGDSRSPGPYVLADNVRQERVPLYVEDIRDPRGDEVATPAGFGRLVTRQPEFAACMSEHVVGHVFGNEGTKEDKALVRRAFEKSSNPKSLVRAALLLYAQRWTAPAPPIPAANGSDGPAADSAEQRLRSLVEKHCLDCHDGGQEPSLALSLSPTLLMRMTSQVSFGRMPWGANAMSAAEREQLIRAAVALALPTDEARQRALGYFIGQQRALPVHRIETAFDLVDHAARETPSADGDGPAAAPRSWTLYERAPGMALEDQAWTPSFGAVVGLRALERCRQTAANDDELDRCLSRATDPDLLSKTPVHRVRKTRSP